MADYRIQKILEKITEPELFKYMKSYFPDLIDLNPENKFSSCDWYIPSYDIYIEAKCRYFDSLSYFIEESKYKKLIQYEKSWYLNSTPNGVYYWDVQEMDLIFRNVYMTDTQQFGPGKKVLKSVADLLISRASQLDHLIFR